MYRAALPGNATVYVTSAAEGDFVTLALAAKCSLVRQIHGNSVRRVESGQVGELGDGDALVSTSREVALAVRGADCPLLGLSCEEGVIAAVHAGWKGLLGGVIEQTVAAMRIFGATTISAVVGPFIGVQCYEFSEVDLLAMIDRFGGAARGETSFGTAALDLNACLNVTFSRLEIVRQMTLGSCTSCSDDFYSWRARKDAMRHALIISRSLDFAGQCGALAL